MKPGPGSTPAGPHVVSIVWARQPGQTLELRVGRVHWTLRVEFSEAGGSLLLDRVPATFEMVVDSCGQTCR